MNLLLRDWKLNYDGKEEFDKSHFHTRLMKEGDEAFTEKEYQLIFNSFPHADELILRLKKYYSEEHQEIISGKDELISTVAKDLKEKSVAIDDDEIASVLALPLKFADKISEVERAQLNEWHADYISILNDYILDVRYSDGPKVSALFEAYYGLTHNYQLVWYLGRPLIETNINFDYYFDIWRCGGEYAVTAEGVIISKR